MAHEPIVVSFQFSKPELRRGLRALAIRIRSTWAFIAAPLVNLLVGLTILALDPAGKVGLVIVGIAGFFLVTSLGTLAVRPGRIISPKVVLAEQRYEFGEQIESHTAASDTRLSWELIDRAAESKEFFILFLNKRTGLIIPKRAFPAGSFDSFRSLVTDKVGEKAKLRSAS